MQHKKNFAQEATTADSVFLLTAGCPAFCSFLQPRLQVIAVVLSLIKSIVVTLTGPRSSIARRRTDSGKPEALRTVSFHGTEGRRGASLHPLAVWCPSSGKTDPELHFSSWSAATQLKPIVCARPLAVITFARRPPQNSDRGPTLFVVLVFSVRSSPSLFFSLKRGRAINQIKIGIVTRCDY